MRLRSTITGLFFLAALVVLALLPIPYKGRLATVGLVHECVHIGAFSLAFLLLCGSSRTPRASVGVGVILLVFGIALEVFQTRIYGTVLEYRDISANAAGTMLGFVGRSIWMNSTLRSSG